MFYPNDGCCTSYPLGDLWATQPTGPRFEWKFQIFPYRVPWIKRELLQHESDISLGRAPAVYVLPIDIDDAGIRAFEPGNQTKRCCLAGTSGA